MNAIVKKIMMTKMMKIKKYTDFLNETVNHDKVDDLMQKIRDRFDESEVMGMYDEELTGGGWLDEGWEDEFESEIDAYQEQGRGEAEDAVIDQIIQSVDDGTLSTDDTYELRQQIADEYNLMLH